MRRPRMIGTETRMSFVWGEGEKVCYVSVIILYMTLYSNMGIYN